MSTRTHPAAGVPNNAQAGADRSSGRLVLPADSTELRESIIRTARRLQEQRVLPGALGNFSVRLADGRFLVTPTSRDYRTMEPGDLAIVSADGSVVHGPFPPSIEIGMHRAIYAARPDVGAVIHTHAPYASTLAALGRPLPFLDELTRFSPGPVRVAAYGPAGSDELARNAVAALGGTNAVFLAMHGLIAVGPDLSAAEQVAEVIEHLAGVYLRALQSA